MLGIELIGMRTRLTLLLFCGAAIAALMVVASSAHTRLQRRAAVAVAAVPTFTFSHLGRLPAPRADTFVSLVPSCGCGRDSSLDQFSLSDGRKLGTIGALSGLGSSSWQTSDPHPGPAGSFVLTFTRGPLCTEPPGGGVSFGPCNPRPDTCTSAIEQIDTRSGSVTTLLNQPASITVTDALPSPDGRRLALTGGGCSPSGRFITVRDLTSGHQWTLGADMTRCTGIGPAAWSPDGRDLVFPYWPAIGRPPSDPNFCTADRLGRLVIAPADHSSTSRSWRQIHADPHCAFLYAVFDRRGIAAVEGCKFGGPPNQPSDPHLGAAFVVQLSGPRHQVVQRIQLARGFDGGTVVTDRRTGAVLISEYQAANNGTHPFNWVWSYADGTLQVIHRYHENDAPEITAEPW